MKLKTNKNTSGDFRRNELIQGGTAENPGAYFGAYCLLFRPESPLNSVNGIQFYVTLVPYKSMSPGIFRNKRKAPKTAWEPLQNLYSPVRIWMAPHEETLQNQRLQGFRFSPRRGSQEARGLSRGLLVILPFFLPRLGDRIGHNIGRKLIKKVHKILDDGKNVEIKKDPNGKPKVLKVSKELA